MVKHRLKTALKEETIWPRNEGYDGAENLFGTKKTKKFKIPLATLFLMLYNY